MFNGWRGCIVWGLRASGKADWVRTGIVNRWLSAVSLSPRGVWRWFGALRSFNGLAWWYRQRLAPARRSWGLVGWFQNEGLLIGWLQLHNFMLEFSRLDGERASWAFPARGRAAARR